MPTTDGRRPRTRRSSWGPRAIPSTTSIGPCWRRCPTRTVTIPTGRGQPRAPVRLPTSPASSTVISANFGPYEDAMTERSWHLAHSLLSPYLNIGLLIPTRCSMRSTTRTAPAGCRCRAPRGSSARSLVGASTCGGCTGRGLNMPRRTRSAIGIGCRRRSPVRPARRWPAWGTRWVGLRRRAWVHHIPRLMILSNLLNLYGTAPQRVLEWMSDEIHRRREWVMVPNVIGMAMWADGGRMATKPYVSGGAYINRMSDHCRGCRYMPPSAPVTTPARSPRSTGTSSTSTGRCSAGPHGWPSSCAASSVWATSTTCANTH